MSSSEVPDPNRLAVTKEVSDFLQIPVGTLDQWAHRGVGPRYSKIGKHRRYRWSDVLAYVEENVKGHRVA